MNNEINKIHQSHSHQQPLHNQSSQQTRPSYKRKYNNSNEIYINNVLIILGCDTYDELTDRLNTSIKIAKQFEQPSIIFLTGTQHEISYMRNKLDSCTIDNIYNSFNYLYYNRLLTLPSGDGHFIEKEIVSYRNVHILSSYYHIARIKVICDNLNISKNCFIVFHKSEVTNKLLGTMREKNEKRLKENIKEYIQIIKMRNGK